MLRATPAASVPFKNDGSEAVKYVLFRDKKLNYAQLLCPKPARFLSFLGGCVPLRSPANAPKPRQLCHASAHEAQGIQPAVTGGSLSTVQTQKVTAKTRNKKTESNCKSGYTATRNICCIGTALNSTVVALVTIRHRLESVIDWWKAILSTSFQLTLAPSKHRFHKSEKSVVGISKALHCAEVDQSQVMFIVSGSYMCLVSIARPTTGLWHVDRKLAVSGKDLRLQLRLPQRPESSAEGFLLLHRNCDSNRLTVLSSVLNCQYLYHQIESKLKKHLTASYIHRNHCVENA